MTTFCKIRLGSPLASISGRASVRVNTVFCWLIYLQYLAVLEQSGNFSECRCSNDRSSVQSLRRSSGRIGGASFQWPSGNERTLQKAIGAKRKAPRMDVHALLSWRVHSESQSESGECPVKRAADGRKMGGASNGRKGTRTEADGSTETWKKTETDAKCAQKVRKEFEQTDRN